MTFGRHLLGRWPLDPAIAYLNHGTVGVTPTSVQQRQDAIRLEIERQPARFMRHHLRPRLREAADAVGRFLGAAGDDIVFVENATTGINAVLRSLGFAPGDEILICDHTYPAVRNAVAFVCRPTGAVMTEARLPFPLATPDGALAALDAALTARTRLVVIDHVTSQTGLKLPIAEMAALIRRRGALSLVDAAHAPGMFAYRIDALGVDWYVANLHKWLFAPRGTAILWCAGERQQGLHPAVISHGLDKGFHEEFAWTGTRDFSAWLAAPAGIEVLEQLGPAAAWRHNRDLAIAGAQAVAARWGTEASVPAGMTESIALVAVPERFGTTADEASDLRDRLLFQHGIECAVYRFGDRLWARVSAQVYNDMADFERLARALN